MERMRSISPLPRVVLRKTQQQLKRPGSALISQEDSDAPATKKNCVGPTVAVSTSTSTPPIFSPDDASDIGIRNAENCRTSSPSATNSQVSSDYSKCFYCRAQFKDTCGISKQQMFHQHTAQYHCEHYFPSHRLDSITSPQFKKIVAELLFEGLMNNRRCKLCRRKFFTYSKLSFTTQIKSHLVEFHHKQLEKKLKDIQDDPELTRKLEKCNPSGRICECGVYISNPEVQKGHEQVHCILAKNKASSDKDKVTCHLCSELITRVSMLSHDSHALDSCPKRCGNGNVEPGESTSGESMCSRSPPTNADDKMNIQIKSCQTQNTIAMFFGNPNSNTFIAVLPDSESFLLQQNEEVFHVLDESTSSHCKSFPEDDEDGDDMNIQIRSVATLAVAEESKTPKSEEVQIAPVITTSTSTATVTPIITSAYNDERLSLECSYCRATFHDTALSLGKPFALQMLRHHKIQYHCEHFYPHHKLSWIADGPFKKIVAELLFMGLLSNSGNTSCAFCDKKFILTYQYKRNKMANIIRIKSHYLDIHYPKLEQKLFEIQQIPESGFFKTLYECNPSGKICGCGVYIANDDIQKVHEQFHCFLTAEQGQNESQEGNQVPVSLTHLDQDQDQDEITCKLCGEQILRVSMFPHFMNSCPKGPRKNKSSSSGPDKSIAPAQSESSSSHRHPANDNLYKASNDNALISGECSGAWMKKKKQQHSSSSPISFSSASSSGPNNVTATPNLTGGGDDPSKKQTVSEENAVVIMMPSSCPYCRFTSDDADVMDMDMEMSVHLAIYHPEYYFPSTVLRSVIHEQVIVQRVLHDILFPEIMPNKKEGTTIATCTFCGKTFTGHYKQEQIGNAIVVKRLNHDVLKVHILTNHLKELTKRFQDILTDTNLGQRLSNSNPNNGVWCPCGMYLPSGVDPKNLEYHKSTQCKLITLSNDSDSSRPEKRFGESEKNLGLDFDNFDKNDSGSGTGIGMDDLDAVDMDMDSEDAVLSDEEEVKYSESMQMIFVPMDATDPLKLE